MGGVELSVAVMAHPSRRQRAASLARRLRGRLVLDPAPEEGRNPWRCARLAWAATTPGATHHLVIQDDAIPCPGFLAAARSALAAKPDAPVSFFCNWLGFVIARAQQEAMEKCSAWAQLPLYGWYPTVALALPVGMAESLASFQNDGPAVADDAVVARWVNVNRLRVWQTCPSLVQHDELVPSLMTEHTYMDRGAACYVGPHARLIDWRRG